MLHEEIAHRFSPYLEPDESVLWTGRPPQGLLLRREDALFIPMSAFMLVFLVQRSLSWWSFPTGDADVVTPAALIFALYLAIGRFFADAHFRSTSYYAVTDSRILIIGGFRGKSLEAHDFPNAKEVVVRQGKDGLGTVEFGPRWPFLKWHSTYFQNLEFYRTPNAEVAADLIRKRGVASR